LGTSTDLSNVLFPSVRAEILGLLFSQPERRFYVRELVELIGKGHGQTARELQRLGDTGILSRSRSGKQLYYQANPACPIFEELRGIAVKTIGVPRVLEAALAPLSDRIEVAFVYGSFARGQSRADSDVDVMVIGEVSFADVVEAVRPAEAKLSREVSPSVYSSEELRQRASDGNHFIRSVLSGDKIFLIGGPDELEQLSR
jgi:predicted nucleotidyltransferase